jgi:GNAT superfamily N-acetyltransferase
VIDRRSPGAAEILWIAVADAERGQGFGSVLLDPLITELAGEGVQLLEVKTLDRSANYQGASDAAPASKQKRSRSRSGPLLPRSRSARRM